jgi:DNA mismatch endonuclease (patch repair protein)
MVFPKRRAVVFVHGCFWHGHDCHLFRLPSTRRDFWQEKILGNVERDQRAIEALHQSGWRVGVVWECALKGKTKLAAGAIYKPLAGWLVDGVGDLEVRGLPT